MASDYLNYLGPILSLLGLGGSAVGSTLGSGTEWGSAMNSLGGLAYQGGQVTIGLMSALDKNDGTESLAYAPQSPDTGMQMNPQQALAAYQGGMKKRQQSGLEGLNPDAMMADILPEGITWEQFMELVKRGRQGSEVG
jgi:hypothetical protein